MRQLDSNPTVHSMSGSWTLNAWKDRKKDEEIYSVDKGDYLIIYE